MSRFVAINLANVPPPPIVEPLDFETIKAAGVADAVVRLNAAGVTYNAQTLESDPVVKVIEAFAYRELLLRARINDAVKAVLLASTWAGNMDQVAALLGVERQDGEIDERFQRRTQLALEAFSTCGPEAAYIFYALTVLPTMRDASAMMTRPGYVLVTLLKEGDDPLPTVAELDLLTGFLKNEPVRPLTDIVTVARPIVMSVAIDADLILFPGPDTGMVLAASLAALNTLLDKNRLLGYSLTRSAIFAALQSNGVMEVLLSSPAADLLLDETQVYNITSINVKPSARRET